MAFTYFKGPPEDMAQLLNGNNPCSICGNMSQMCFSLEYATTTLFTEAEKHEKVGCAKCLNEGKFEFSHNTELGRVDENGFTNEAKTDVSSEMEDTLTELRRTPPILTWQEELWLSHCDDFMVYKGTWQPSDFYQNSKNGNGRDLFLEMTDPDWNHLWDESLEDGKSELKSWYATYYTFECRHCGKLRGNWDCS